MSRLAKIPIEIPGDVKVNVNGSSVQVEGPKGKLDLKVPHGVEVEIKDNAVKVNRTSDVKQHRANHGTIRAHIKNMILGVKDGHKKELEIQGIGFRAQLQGKKITFNLGLSHPVEFEVPQEVDIKLPSQTQIELESMDIEAVGQTAAKIRDLKKVEPYKGKGIRYVGEFVRRKQGKSVTK